MNKDWIDIAVLEDYLDGKLDAKAMNRVEREALEDPFVAEALAGLSAAPKRSRDSISLLQKQLQERIAEHQHSKKATIITWQRLSIAATAAVLFISVGIIFWMKQNNYQDMQARQPKKVEVSLAPRAFEDSIAKSETQAVVVASVAPDTLKAKTIERAITLAKSDAYASKKKARNHAVITSAEPISSPATAGEPASVLKEVAVATASPAVQKTVAFSTTDVTAPGETKIVTGRVIDIKSGAPLSNAGIFVSTPLKGVGQADQNGNFSVAVPTDATDLTFTSTGYINQRVKIIGDSFDVAMQGNRQGLDEVVIRGYQKRSREQTTGSSFIVTGKEVKDVPVANVEQLLQGKVAGLNIQNNFSAVPSIGWDKFMAYMIKTNRFGKDSKPGQRAEFKFSVKKGRPVEISTVSGVSKDYDEEAIRLIKNGPGWILSNPAHPEVNIVLRF